MWYSRVDAILNELRLDLREQSARRVELKALLRLGQAAAGAGPDDLDIAPLYAEVRSGEHKLDALRSAVTESLEADKEDYIASAPWIRPIVVLRGICARAILRHHAVSARRALAVPEAGIGMAVANRPAAFRRHPEEVKAVADARAMLRAVREERKRKLEPFGGSALPSWFPHLGRESTVLGKALWLQLRPTILPRGTALAGLAMGWWLANTYTDSHFRSAMHSLGLGSGGKRVVTGDTYQAMMFWLPILAAAIFAYLVDRAHYLVQRRYSRSTPPA
ncbi:MAG TPA: hypothetical protein VGP44_05430 [Gemmatimonadales bacterium]|nr:hypothetical protein [Gemmatimonadales bacterium]